MSATDESDLAGAYAGERIFLIGNGPSLAETPLDALQDEYTMAMNKIDLIYDAVDWRPDFYVCTHRLESVNSQLRRSIKLHERLEATHSFLDADLQGLVSEPDSEITFLHVNYMQDIQQPNPMNVDTATVRAAAKQWLKSYWSYDISQFVWAFHTMYVAAQLSLWMGFDQIYFVGTDLGHGKPVHMRINNGIDPISYKGRKFQYFRTAHQENKLISAIVNGLSTKFLLYVRKIGGINLILGPDKDHFDPSYQGQTIAENPDAELERSHVVIKRICEYEDVRVRNATLGGELEVYPRVSLHELLCNE